MPLDLRSTRPVGGVTSFSLSGILIISVLQSDVTSFYKSLPMVVSCGFINFAIVKMQVELGLYLYCE